MVILPMTAPLCIGWKAYIVYISVVIVTLSLDNILNCPYYVSNLNSLETSALAVYLKA